MEAVSGADKGKLGAPKILHHEFGKLGCGSEKAKLLKLINPPCPVGSSRSGWEA
jgi:hypothetical protein